MELTQSVLRPEERLTLALRGLYERCGYKKYKMSQFEEYRLYMENKNFLASEAVIAFTDLDGRLLALKPDVTLSIVKHAALGQTEKVYYLENVYRPGKAQRSFREISQMGLEHLGVIDDYAIGEVVFLAAQSLSAVSPESLLEVNHMGFALALLQACRVSEGTKDQLLRFMAQKNLHQLAAAAQAAGVSDENVARLCETATLSGSFEAVLPKARALCLCPEMCEAVESLERLRRALSAQGCSCPVQVDLSLLGETDYYNGIIFAGYISGLPDKVLSGGQYDQVLRRMGRTGGAIGFALYLSDLELLFEPAAYTCDTLVRYTKTADLAALCRYLRRETTAGRRVYACGEGEQVRGLAAAKTVLFDENGAGEVETC